MKNKLFLTESEKSRISGLHRRAIVNESKNMLNEVDLKQIQQLLMQKLGPESLGPQKDDGRLGTFTLNAIYSALTQTQGTQPTGTQPTGTQPTGTQPTAPTTASTTLPPPNTDGSDETFEAPVKYPWIGTDGKESLASIKTATDTDPNLTNWLAELKKMSLDQLNKIKEDFRSFLQRIGQTGMDPFSNQPVLITKDRIDTAIKMVGNSKVTQ